MNTQVADLLSETIKALLSRRITVAVILLASLGVGVGVGVQTAADLQQIQTRNQQLLENGWGLITLQTLGGGRIEAQACGVAAAVPGVERAGKVGGELSYTALGIEAGLAVRQVSAETIKIAWPDAPITTSPAYATGGFQKLHGIAGGILYLGQGGSRTELPIEALPAGGRFKNIDGQVLVLTQTLQMVDYCLIQVNPLQVEEMALAIANATATYNALAVPATAGYEISPTPRQLLENYRSRMLPVIAPVALLLTAGLYQLLTRRDRAVYRLVGIRRTELWLMGLVQFILLSILPSLAGLSVLCIYRFPGLDIAAEVLLVDISTLLLANAFAALIFATINATGRNTHQFAAS